MKQRRPKRSLILARIIVPCVDLFLVGGMLLASAGKVRTELLGANCGGVGEAGKLDMHWNAASDFLLTCRAKNPALGDMLLVNHCPGYEDAMWKGNHEKYWTYLQHL